MSTYDAYNKTNKIKINKKKQAQHLTPGDRLVLGHIVISTLLIGPTVLIQFNPGKGPFIIAECAAHYLVELDA